VSAPVRVSSSAGVVADALGLVLVTGGTVVGVLTGRLWAWFFLALVVAMSVALVGRAAADAADAADRRRQPGDHEAEESSASHWNPRK
jgi:hypothetical protein